MSSVDLMCMEKCEKLICIITVVTIWSYQLDTGDVILTVHVVAIFQSNYSLSTSVSWA